jgi:hypothetical protein
MFREFRLIKEKHAGAIREIGVVDDPIASKRMI